MTREKIETRLERVCIALKDTDRCGTCLDCRYGRVADQLAAMAYDFYRATNPKTPRADVAKIKEHWRGPMLVHRELAPGQERYIAKTQDCVCGPCRGGNHGECRPEGCHCSICAKD